MGNSRWEPPLALVALGLGLAAVSGRDVSAQVMVFVPAVSSPASVAPAPASAVSPAITPLTDAAPPPPLLPPVAIIRLRLVATGATQSSSKPDGGLARTSLASKVEGEEDASKAADTPKPSDPTPATKPGAGKVKLLGDLQNREPLETIRFDIQDADKKLQAAGKNEKRERDDIIFNLVKNTYAWYVGVYGADASRLEETQRRELRDLIANRNDQDDAAPATPRPASPAAPDSPPSVSVPPPPTPGADLSGGTPPGAPNPAPPTPPTNPGTNAILPPPVPGNSFTGTPGGTNPGTPATPQPPVTGGGVVHILVPNTVAQPAMTSIPVVGPVQLLIPVGRPCLFPRLGLFR